MAISDKEGFRELGKVVVYVDLFIKRGTIREWWVREEHPHILQPSSVSGKALVQWDGETLVVLPI